MSEGKVYVFEIYEIFIYRCQRQIKELSSKIINQKPVWLCSSATCYVTIEHRGMNTTRGAAGPPPLLERAIQITGCLYNLRSTYTLQKIFKNINMQILCALRIVLLFYLKRHGSPVGSFFLGCCLSIVATANTDIFSPDAKVRARTTACVSVDTNMS